MSEAFTLIEAGDVPILIVCDHASNHVPADIDLGIAPALLNDHVAIDIGAAEVAAQLASRLSCTAILGGVSRLVIDLNREEDSPGLLVMASDGHAVPGNRSADLHDRIARFYHPYHAEVAARLDAMHRPFILSLHSFTPHLASDPGQQRPWEVGILYNEDERGARIAIPMLEQAGFVVGDQLPYSGKLLNATMNRHAEDNAIPYLGIEMRQDIASTHAGQGRFVDALLPVVERCRAELS